MTKRVTRGRLIGGIVLALGACASFSPLFWWEGLLVDAWGIGFLSWQMLPFAVLVAIHAARSFSDAGALVTGVGLAILTVTGHVVMHRDESSTAALGFIWFPMGFALVVAAAWLVDLGARAVAARLGRRGPDIANPS